MPSATITVSGSSSFCFGDSATLNSSTGTGISYLWYKNGTPLMSDTFPSLTVNAPGNYKVQLLSADGCLDESSPEIITVSPLPLVNLFALSSSVFCNGDSVILQTNADTGYNYIWYKNGVSLLGDTLYQLNAYTTGNYSVRITNANNCSALSSSASIIANPIPTSTFSLATAACSQDTVNIAYTGNASSAAFLNWDFDGGVILSGTGLGPYQVKWDSAGYRNVTLLVSDNNCISPLETNILEVKSIVSNISSANTSVCQGDSVMLYANAGASFTYQWYQGGLQMPTANASSLITTQTGNYQVKVTDTIVGCSLLSTPIGVTINSTNFGIAFTANTTSFTQPPFNVNFTNQTPNMSNYQFDWDLGDGNTSTFYNPSHNYQYNGSYTVNLYAEDASTGCRDTLTKTNYISCSGGSPNPCMVLASISPAGPVTICNGDSVLLHANAGTGYSYNWVYNNMVIPNADSIVFTAKNAGVYRVMVSDSICSQTSPAFVLNHYPSIQPVILPSGNIQPCTSDSMNLGLFVSYNTYNWSTGSTASNIYINQTGYYQVAVTDNYGCNMTSAPYVVSNSFLNPPELCMVGVDSANHNRLIWERHSSVLIDSFYVYKESYIAGQYDKIGSIPYSQTSLFVDVNSNPAVKSYRYKIAAVDTCGGLTLLGNYHKTIHLTINAGLNGSWNLIWDGYEGFSFNSYRIYRGTSVNNMTLLTQLASTASSYTDLNPPSGAVYYQIEIIKTTGCYPDTLVSKAKTNYNHSRSNTANSININPVYLDANFNANIQSGVWPIQVEFTDLSTGSPSTWKWNFGDGNTSIEQNPSHTYNNTGVYTVSLVACNGTICDTSVRTDYIEVLPNGIVEIGVALSTKLYPNPNDGNFTLEINDKGSHALQVHIYNVYGAEVFNERFNSNGKTLKQLQLNNLSSGVYFVHLNTKDKIVYRSKIIIEK
jgi:PKD repeat protein